MGEGLEFAEELGGGLLFFGGEGAHGFDEVPGVEGHDAIEQGAAALGDGAEDDAVVFGEGAAGHELAFFEFFDGVGGAGSGEEDAVAELAERGGAAVVEDVEDGELGHGEAELEHAGADVVVDVLEAAADGEDELEGGEVVWGPGGGCGLGFRWGVGAVRHGSTVSKEGR